MEFEDFDVFEEGLGGGEEFGLGVLAEASAVEVALGDRERLCPLQQNLHVFPPVQ